MWWEEAAAPFAPRNSRALLERLEVTSAAAYLNEWFESDALKAALDIFRTRDRRFGATESKHAVQPA